MEMQDMIKEINRLKKEKNAVILAHNYQIPEVQDIADYVGDSLELSRKAIEIDGNLIVVCGVYFLAESIKILLPSKKVLFPVLDARCSRVDMITGEELKAFKREYPNVPIVCNINSSMEIKAESDICCTSSNAIKIVKSLDSDRVLFLTDQNLGNYVSEKVPEKDIISWEGFCIHHHQVQSKEVDLIRAQRRRTKILVHPQCRPDVVKKADFVGSIPQIIEYVKACDDKEFIIGTEMGILHTLRRENPNKKFHLLSPALVCFNMKKTSLENIYNALINEKNEIIVDENIRKKAYYSLEKMLNL